MKTKIPLIVILILFTLGGIKTFAKCSPYSWYKLASELYSIAHPSPYDKTVNLCLSDMDTLKVYYAHSNGACTECLYHPKWFKDGILIAEDSMKLTITTPGLYELKVCYSIFSSFLIATPAHPAPLSLDSLHPEVLNGSLQSESSYFKLVYKISQGECLKVKAKERIPYLCAQAEIVDAPSWWYFKGVPYADTQPGDTMCFDEEGTIIFSDLVNNLSTSWFIQLYVEERLDSSQNPSVNFLPYPFSELPNPVPLTDLYYVIVNPFGQKMEEGKFNGTPVLRNDNLSHTLRAGLYFVIYYDAQTQSRVLTDKVLVLGKQQ